MRSLFLLLCLLIDATAEAITVGRVVADGNVNVRSTPEVRPDNVVGFLPDGATVIIFDKTAQPDTIDGVVDYWYDLTGRKKCPSCADPVGNDWIFGFSLELIEVTEFYSYNDLIETAEKIDAKNPYCETSQSNTSINALKLVNVDFDEDYEVFVEYGISCGSDTSDTARYISMPCILDKIGTSSSYKRIAIGSPRTCDEGCYGVRSAFIAARNLVGDSAKELILENCDDGDDCSGCSWGVYRFIDGDYKSCGGNFRTYGGCEGYLYRGRGLFKNLDEDLELEIEVVAKEDDDPYNDEPHQYLRINEAYDFNGSEYVRISRTETPVK